ncbi:MAG: PAS domain S-box protein [Sulfuricellaceae bacterium]
MPLPIGQEIADAALLDELFRDAPMVFYMAKADGSYATTYISPNVERILGFPPEACLASMSYWQDRVHPEDFERVMREFALLFDTGCRIVEYRFLGGRGDYLWVRDETHLVRAPDSAPAYLTGYWHDISAHKNQEAALLATQQALQEKDRFLQSVLDNIPQRLFWKDRRSVFHGCNLAGAREVGLVHPEDIAGKTDFNLHPNPMVADYLRITDEAVMAAGQATYHAAIPLQQGVVWLDVSKVPLRDEKGEVNGLLVSYEDISTQKKTEIALRNFKRAVEQSSDAIVITNRDGDIEYVNPRFLAVYGYAEQEVLGKNPRLLKSGVHDASTYQDLWQTILGGKGWHGELVNQAKNGEHSWQSVSISPIFDENGVMTHFLAIQDDISGRKRIEEALRQSEERFRTIANYTYNWENWIDPHGKLLWVNPGVERVTGYTPEECYAMADFPIGIIYSDDRAIAVEHYAQTLSGADHRPLEFRILRKDGEVRWGEVSLQQVYDVGGAPLGHRSTVRDITEHRQIMDSLHDTKEMLQLVLDHIPQGIFWKDRNIAYLGGNAVFARDTGQDSRNGIKGLTDFDFFPAEEAEHFRRDDQEVMRSNQALVNREEKFTNAGGSERWALTSKVPLHNRDGEVFGVLGAYTDITESKQAQELLSQSELKFSTLYNSTSDAVMLLDENGFFDCNPATLAVFGCATREEFCAQHPADLSPPEQPCGTNSRTLADQRIATALKNGSLRFDWMHRRADTGENFPAEVLLNAMSLEGKPLLQAVVRDITERKRTEAALLALNETLERRVKEETAQNMAQERLLIQQSRHAAMGEMIGNIAHQWRQPLNTLGLIIQNIAYDYQEGILDQDALIEYKNTAFDTVQKMSRTIDDFRNFFRPNHKEETFSLLLPIHEALNLIDAGLKNNTIAVIVDCAENLTAFGSPNEFSQVMLNLLANAKDALVEKNAPVKIITVSVHEEENLVVVSVRDNGCGIPDENMDKIFDPYFTSKESGTGIGLYMTRVIIEQHMHGKITCHNTADGAEFLLYLPRETKQRLEC